MSKTKKRLTILAIVLICLGAVGFYGAGQVLGRALETNGIRTLLAAKTAKVLDCDAGYLPLASNGLTISSRGFLAHASPPRALTEMRATDLHARCDLLELWRGKWRIDNLWVAHLQAAYGPAAAKLINRNEFSNPELEPPSKTETPLELDLKVVDIAQTDLFWGSAPEAVGEFRDVHTIFFPRKGELVAHGTGGTFQQAKFPVAQVQQFKLFYAKPDLRIDEALLTLGGQSSITVLGNFRFAEQSSFDLQLTLARCPVAPFLNQGQRFNLAGEFDATAHLQKDSAQTESMRALGSITISKAILRNVSALENVASFTGRQELARMALNQIKADYTWNAPTLTVKNFILESNDLLVVKGEFTVKDKKIDGEFQLGVTPELVDKFPGAREEVFKRSADGYLWTDLGLSGTTDNLRDNLRPRLLEAAKNHFAKGLLAPIVKPGQTVIQAIEAL